MFIPLRQITLACIFFAFMISCNGDTDDKRLLFSLEFADDNRVELEKVLSHYQNEPLKLSAARFLIINMPHYYTLVNSELDIAKEYLIQAYHRNNDLTDEELTKGNSFQFVMPQKVYDAHIITADYLIENIELAFEEWDKRPWNKYLGFDDFCQYVLPYRIDTEPLENWRKLYRDRYEMVLDSLYKGSDVIEATNLLNCYISKQEKLVYNADFHYFNPGPLFYMDYKIGDCSGQKNIFLYILRSLGIASACDYYVCSAALGTIPHVWVSVRDTTGLSVSYPALGEPIRRNVYVGYKKGKVYRNLYGVRNDYPKELLSEQRVPVFFKNPYIKDVTGDYFEPNKLTVELDDPSGEKYAYLGVQTFHRSRLIDMAPVKGNKATFENVEPDLVYQVFYAHGPKLIPAGYPVLFDGKNVRPFKPDTTQRESYSFYRKYPLPDWLHRHINYLVGTRVEASVSPDFKEPVLIHHFQDSIRDRIRQSIYPDLPVRYKYIRFTFPEQHPVLLSDVLLYNQQDTITPLKTSITGDQPRPVHKNGYLENILDNDPLTYYYSEKDGAQFTLKLEENQSIYKIEVVPRTDDNFIRPGDHYELFYHNGAKGWASLGDQFAAEDYLHYDNIPENALFWLYDSTRGNEEQVFYLHKGKQVFTGKEPVE